MIGQQIGNYTIDAEVGRSAMGPVFRAHLADDPARVVALKWLTHEKADNPDFEKQFLAQVELVRRLRHPAIVSVFGGGEHEGKPFYIAEWMDGPTLEAVLRSGDRPTWKEVLVIALQIVPALRYAHRRSVLHRDIKPGNLFRAADDCYKLSDFGVTKFFGDALLTNTENILGSAAYLSPETAAGKAHTKRSDFYSLGALLYTLLVGRPPFVGQTVVELMHKHSFILPERPIHFIRDLPEEMDRLVMKLLAKDPSQRPGSGSSLIQELEAIWSALERRGQVGKRPVKALADDADGELPIETDDSLPVRELEPIPQPPMPWHKKPHFVIPMFSLCAGLLIWTFFFRGPSADDLMASARPLMDSERPADWERAWNDYLEPLSRKYPGQYADELKEFQRRRDEQGEMRRSLASGKLVRYRSEAERFYYEGLRLAQSGEFSAARQVWQNAVRVFGSIDADKHWVQLAGIGIERLPPREEMPLRPSDTVDLKAALQPVLAEIRKTRDQGKSAEANAIRKAVEELYRDDPERQKVYDWLKE